MSSCTIVFQVFIPAKLAFQERLKNLSSFFAYFPIDTSRDTNLGPLAKKEEKHGGTKRVVCLPSGLSLLCAEARGLDQPARNA
jgi:hypothetical protein